MCTVSVLNESYYYHSIMPRSKDDYVFFWKPESANGWASQWYYSPFKAQIDIEVPGHAPLRHPTECEFATAEHWMMACKAVLFDDADVFARVLAAPADDMRGVKALGRAVRGFDDARWAAFREAVVVAGNVHKFAQNEEAREMLLRTGERVLVEASPRDRIWGIGFGEKKALEVRDRWGLNLLGRALGVVRERLRKEQELAEAVQEAAE